MSGYYRDPTRQNQYNRYTYAREGMLPKGEHGGRPMSVPVKSLVSRGTPQYGQLPPMEGEHIGRNAANKIKRLVTEAIKIEALQAGITGSWAPGFSDANRRPESSGDQVPEGDTSIPQVRPKTTKKKKAGAKMPSLGMVPETSHGSWIGDKSMEGKKVDPLFGGEKLSW